jgi:NAD(P)-dependent dehydrogenase (short-subunit alcohol dehydrogenase family)
MSNSLSNKLITITGAASGIGLSTARKLAQRGALLSIADNNHTKLVEAQQELASISSDPKNIYSTTLDIRNTSAVTDWISETKKHFGRTVDGCANVAGMHPLWTPKNVEEITDEEFEEVMQVNAFGLFKCMRAQLAPDILSSPARMGLPSLRPKRRGREGFGSMLLRRVKLIRHWCRRWRLARGFGCLRRSASNA